VTPTSPTGGSLGCFDANFVYGFLGVTGNNGNIGLRLTVTDLSTNGGGLANVRLFNGQNAYLYRINGYTLPTPAQFTGSSGYLIDLSTNQPWSTAFPGSVDVYMERIDNSIPAKFSSHAIDQGGCEGDPAVVTASRGLQSTSIVQKFTLEGAETLIQLNNSGAQQITLGLGTQTLNILGDGGQGFDGTSYHIPLNGSATIPIPSAALGATFGWVSVGGPPSDTASVIVAIL